MAGHYRINPYLNRDAVNKAKASRMGVANILKTTLLFILVINTKAINADESSDNNELVKRMKIIESVSGRYFNDIYQNGTFRTGNNLWDNILNQCSVTPSVSCLQKNVYSYMDDKLDFDGDVKVGGGLCFKKNNVDVKKYSKEANIIYLTGSKDVASERNLDEENEVGDDEEPESPLEEVTDALYSKGVNFLTTHDMKLTLPEFFFDGATLKLSPRALTKTGALNYHTTKFHHHHHLITHHHKPNVNDMNDINAWGLGSPPGQSMNVGEQYSTSNNAALNIAAPNGQKFPIGNVGRPVGPPNPYYRNKKNGPTDPLQAEKEALETQAAEKFYRTLIEKIDTILTPMGASDPGCRERAVCSLDSNELIPAADSKMALRYYRYVQAARDGQEQKDCLSLYPLCDFDYNQI
ncbi:Uncharacterized protein OBRU01_05503 [Operophtera brumata]|uniref:Uncharacterized protein n=1 Tax=Operophtera brumata TaxID=104452 RepID=A0A0L7LM94_OPEBR|nr:Uncharacterized protein OBRU01_05503 [Operophtera brumata]